MEETQLNNGNALSKLRGFLASLSPAERKVGEYTLENPEKVLRMTLDEIAGETGVSDATAVRFCHSLGYESWLSFKFSLVQSLPDSSQIVASNLNRKDKNGVATRKVLMGSIQAIQDTLAIIDDAKIDQAVSLIRKSKKILIAGMGTSSPIAHEMYNRFMRLGLNCQVQTDSYLQIMQVALLDSKDLLIVISQSGDSYDPRRTAAEAKAQGVPVICLTGNALAPLTQFADIVLLSATQDSMPETLSSRISQYALVHALYICLAMRSMDKSIERERAIWNALMKKLPYQGQES
ncbi:MAG: MurR/RpiR family transcriptional regulator [Anaerolineaceae bacterium]|nr:MurR/RpiR family transcriptional regulator [Anaerolineaceae bacterium]